MSNNLKIKTMKDDLAELVKQQSGFSQTEKQEDLSAVVSGIKPSKAEKVKFGSGAASSSTVIAKKGKQDAEISELKNLIGRISKTAPEKEHLAQQQASRQKSMPAFEKTSTKEEIIRDQKALKKNFTVIKPTASKKSGPESNKMNELKDTISKFLKIVKKDSKAKTTDKLAAETKIVADKEKTKKSLWSVILEKFKKTKYPEKTNKLENKNLEKKAEEGKEYNKSGILTTKRTEEISKIKDESEKEAKKDYLFDKNQYIKPENRLIYGKQKYYSSVSKKIKPKEQADGIENLKSVTGQKQKEVLSEKEEYKKLRQGIMKKYHIKLFFLPWKKIAFVSIVILASVGLITYYITSKITPLPPPPLPSIVAGAELEEFAQIKDKVEITQKNIAIPGFLEIKAEEKFNADNNIEIVKLLIKDNNEKSIAPLKEALGNIKIDINNLPENFWGVTTNNYNLFVFKTKQGTPRLGIALKSNDIHSLSKIMEDWEKERIENRKITTLLKPLFMGDEAFEDTSRSFKSASYKNTQIRYIHLPDQNAALNYFIYRDILVVATSKDITFKMIDLISE